jgi:GMP synthase-like glutamine amidotransferase
MALLRDAAARNAPTLGICLGAQLAANALGGAVNPTAA